MNLGWSSRATGLQLTWWVHEHGLGEKVRERMLTVKINAWDQRATLFVQLFG
jgi:hypothetical protein